MGLSGEVGSRGAPGDNVVGPQGEKGDRGIRGDEGIEGKYIIDTFVGPEILISAKGSKGSKGYSGDGGSKGIKGEFGFKGDKVCKIDISFHLVLYL